MGKDHDACPWDAQCCSVVRRRRDHGAAASTPSWTAGDLPEIPYRVSTQDLKPSFHSCYWKGGFFFCLTLLLWFIFLPVKQLFREKASALSSFLLCVWSCPVRDPGPGLGLPHYPGPPPQHFWQRQNGSVPWKGYIFFVQSFNFQCPLCFTVKYTFPNDVEKQSTYYICITYPAIVFRYMIAFWLYHHAKVRR